MFALTSYKEGDLILEEKPLVCCQYSWNTDYKYLACDHCLQPLETAEENVHRLTGNKDLILPLMEYCMTNKNSISECEACGTKYCSLECQTDAWHR